MEKVFSFFIILFLVSCMDYSGKKLGESAHEGAYYHDNIGSDYDKVYGQEDSIQQVLDMYFHGNFVGEPNWFSADTNLHPLLIWIHGGGWLGGDKKDNIFLFQEFLKRGFQVASVNYRMGPGTAPQASEDVICALRWIADHASDYSIDLSSVYVSGSSAGGHLALTTGLAPSSGQTFNCDVSDIQIKGIVNFFGITEIAKNHQFLSENHPEWNYTIAWVGEQNMANLSNKYSPVYMLKSNAPKILTIHGVLDEVVPFEQANILHHRAKELKLNARLIPIEKGNHGGFTDWGWDLAMDEMIDFMQD